MPLIKRYPNRKLYDTEAKKYIALDGIANLLRRGEEIHVIDHNTGEDLTTLTLTQIILEEEKKGSGFLPRNVLSNLVKAGGEKVGELQKVVSTSFGWISQVDEEIKRRFDALVHRGELSAEEASELLEKLSSVGSSLPETVKGSRNKIEGIIKEKRLPTRSEVDRLNAQLDILSSQIEALEENVKSVPKPATKTRKKTNTHTSEK